MLREEISDDQIMGMIRKDPHEGFGLLVQKYRERLYYHVRRIVILHEDADDVLQNSFMKAWQNISEFRGDSSLFTWLFRISTNEAIYTFNKRKKKNSITTDSMEAIFSLSNEGDVYFDGDDAERKLQDAILSLPEKQRLVFNMKYFDDMKYEEMSNILDTSVGALKASYHHAVKKIESYIKTD